MTLNNLVYFDNATMFIYIAIIISYLHSRDKILNGVIPKTHIENFSILPWFLRKGPDRELDLIEIKTLTRFSYNLTKLTLT